MSKADVYLLLCSFQFLHKFMKKRHLCQIFIPIRAGKHSAAPSMAFQHQKRSSGSGGLGHPAQCSPSAVCKWLFSLTLPWFHNIDNKRGQSIAVWLPCKGHFKCYSGLVTDCFAPQTRLTTCTTITTPEVAHFDFQKQMSCKKQ